MQRKWLILTAVSLAFFFLNAATFTSLGVVLFSMMTELHWSQMAAGFSFSLLGTACGLSSPLPAMMMRKYGGRITVTLGGFVLFLGFFAAYASHSLIAFYVATTLLGIGYSLCGNVPSIYLIASWFPDTAARMIGVYLMVGASGSVVGPVLVLEAIVQSSGSWRFHWLAMAVVSAVVGVLCSLLIGDKNKDSTAAQNETPQNTGPDRLIVKKEVKKEAKAETQWNFRSAFLSAPFLLVAASMTMTMAGVTTISSVAVSHLVHHGATPAFAALILSLVSLVATVAKGVAGRLCELIEPRFLLVGGLALQALGNFLLGFAGNDALAYLFVVTFGLGWGLSYLSANIVLLNHFGNDAGARMLSMVWVVATLAAIGPVAAGLIADRFETVRPIFDLYAVLLLLLAVPIANLHGRRETPLSVKVQRA